MFHDLHVLWREPLLETQQSLFFLDQLGYSVVALTHVLAGKLPTDLACPIPYDLPFPVPPKLRILRRCTLVLSDPAHNHRLALLATNYDILALRPTNEKTLQQACQSLDCDIISIDLTMRLEAHFKMKMLAQAVERGIKFEICYGPGIATSDGNARRNLISNATQLIRATRGKGIILSSEAQRATTCRGPADVINLASIWGLGPEKGREALDKLARNVVGAAQMKRSSYRGVVDVVFGGVNPSPGSESGQKKNSGPQKRKADDSGQAADAGSPVPQPSKRELKKRKTTRLAHIPTTSDEKPPLKNNIAGEKHEREEKLTLT